MTTNESPLSISNTHHDVELLSKEHHRTKKIISTSNRIPEEISLARQIMCMSNNL